MPDDPRSNMMIRSVPRSVRLQLGSQAKADDLKLAGHLAELAAMYDILRPLAKARGLTLAQYLAVLVKQQENAK